MLPGLCKTSFSISLGGKQITKEVKPLSIFPASRRVFPHKFTQLQTVSRKSCQDKTLSVALHFLFSDQLML